ncbi:hypothetical protein CEXT_461661 [Caerostris extrusa]|uniref:Uncharacterized protein n=1 Tax=Caerostris extrusa TaxID=172846 RepID=A0AAV4SYW7_CAEEX|nr:hypothetical protein CEXT_461661 [Caerostris extrusa]
MCGILCPAKASESIFHSTGVMRAVRMATKWNSFHIRDDCHCLESHRGYPILPSIQTQRKKQHLCILNVGNKGLIVPESNDY